MINDREEDTPFSLQVCLCSINVFNLSWIVNTKYSKVARKGVVVKVQN